MSEEYVELKDLPKKEQEAKLREYLKHKKESFEKFKENMRGKAKVIVKTVDEKGRVISQKMEKAREYARKAEKHLPKEKPKAKPSQSDSLFGDLGFVGGGSSDNVMPQISSSHMDFGLFPGQRHSKKKSNPKRSRQGSFSIFEGL